MISAPKETRHAGRGPRPENRRVPSGLKPSFCWCLMSELKLRPPLPPFNEMATRPRWFTSGRFARRARSYCFGQCLSMRSRMNAARSMAVSTTQIFAGLSLSKSDSINLRAQRSVAANKMAYFLSSVMGTPQFGFAGRGGIAILHQFQGRSSGTGRSTVCAYFLGR